MRSLPAPWRGAAVCFALFALALAPRALGVGAFLTVDEGVHWLGRAHAFLDAVQTGDYAGTALTGHPGVTTMWLGAAGELLARLLGARDLDQQQLVRLPAALVTALCVALAYLPLRRLFGGGVALLAGLLWATSPFLVAHSQLLHVDALLSSFMALSLLLAMVAFGLGDEAADQPIAWGALATSALVGGLALLTKSPAALLAPLVCAIAWAGWRAQARPQRAGRHIVAVAAWGGIALVVWAALWPAVWVDPLDAIGLVVGEAIGNGGQPHGLGNFFMGQAVADPGPLFYPVALAMRLTPVAILGLLLAPLALAAWRVQPRRRAALALTALLPVLLVCVLSVLAKKFDRYALPAFPAIAVVAAAGLYTAWRPLAARLRMIPSGIGWGFLGLALSVNLLWYHPYELAYYNPLLGGGAAAQRVLPVGWGEGYERAGAFISTQPGGCSQPTAVWYRVLVERFACGPLITMREFAAGKDAGYVIMYIDELQRGYYPQALDRLRAGASLVHTVRIRGIDYAQIYQLAPAMERPLATRFGDAVELRGYAIDVRDDGESQSLTLTLGWHSLAHLSADVQLFVHVLSPNGDRVAQVDVLAGVPGAPTSAWLPGEYVTQVQRVPLPNDLMPGIYWLALGLVDPRSGVRLSLEGAQPGGAPPIDAGAAALLLGPLPLGDAAAAR